MKKIYRSFALVLTLALVLSLIPLAAFAAETDNANPKAAFVITDKNNNKIDLQFDYFQKAFTNFPNEGDKIRVFYSGNTTGTPNEEYIYKNGAFDDKGAVSPFKFSIIDCNYENSTVKLQVSRIKNPYLYDSGYIFYILSNVSVKTARAPLSGFTFSPSVVSVPSESIKMKDASGKDIYSLKKRATHNAPDGYSWKSSFAEGDSITVTFKDGSSKKFVNKNIITNYGYEDYFVGDDNERVWVKSNNYILTAGINDLSLYILGQSESINAPFRVYVKEPGMPDYKDESTQPSKSTANTTKQNNKVTANTTKNATAIKVPVPKNMKVSRTGKKLKVSWKALTKDEKRAVSKIQIQYSTNKQFRNAKSAWVASSKKSYTTKKLKKGRYYVRLRNMKKIQDKQYYTKWSKVKSVKIR